MILLEQLYRLLAADEQVRYIDPFWRRQQLSAANVSVAVSLLVPERHAFLLTSFSCVFAPGAGQNITFAIVDTFGIVTGLIPRLRQQTAALAANIQLELAWQGELLMPAGSTIRADGGFNAGAVANSVDASFHGTLIPLGNVERI